VNDDSGSEKAAHAFDASYYNTVDGIKRFDRHTATDV